MPSFSLASSMIGRFLASWAIWMSVFGLVCCDAGIFVSSGLTKKPHPEEARSAVSKGGPQSCCCPSFETRRCAALLRMRFCVSDQPCADGEVRGLGPVAGGDLGAVSRLDAGDLDAAVGADDGEAVGLDRDDLAVLAADALGILGRERRHVEHPERL